MLLLKNLNISYFSQATYWRSANTSYILRRQWETFNLSTEPATNIDKLIEKIDQNAKFDLNAIKKVFYGPECDYPRNKLAQNSKVKRSLSIKNADAILVSRPTKGGYSTAHLLVFERKQGESISYVVIKKYEHSMNQYDKEQLKEISKQLFNGVDIDLITIDQYISLLQKTDGNHPCTYTLVYDGMCTLYTCHYAMGLSSLVNETKPIYFTETVDAALNGELLEITDDLLEVFNEYLCSTDSGTVDLGLKLLLNYDVLKRACAVTTLLLRHASRIMQTRACKQIEVKHMLESLNLNLKFVPQHTGGILSKIAAAIKVSTSKEDIAYGKKMAQDLVKGEVEAELKNFQERFNEPELNLSSLSITW